MLAGAFSDDIAIDLGTANTLVHVVGPRHHHRRAVGGGGAGARRQREVLAVGPQGQGHADAQARPSPSRSCGPMRDGVIADFIATEEMLRQFIGRAKTMLGLPPPAHSHLRAGRRHAGRAPRGVRDGHVGGRAQGLSDRGAGGGLAGGRAADRRAGRRSWWSTSAAAPPTSPCSPKGNVVQARSLQVAGNAMDEAIMRYVRRKHQPGDRRGQRRAHQDRGRHGAGAAQRPAGRDPHQGPRPAQGRLKDVVLGPPTWPRR